MLVRGLGQSAALVGRRCVDVPFRVRVRAPAPFFRRICQRIPWPGMSALAHFADLAEGSGPPYGQRDALRCSFLVKSGTAQICRSGSVRRCRCYLSFALCSFVRYYAPLFWFSSASPLLVFRCPHASSFWFYVPFWTFSYRGTRRSLDGEGAQRVGSLPPPHLCVFLCASGL